MSRRRSNHKREHLCSLPATESTPFLFLLRHQHRDFHRIVYLLGGSEDANDRCCMDTTVFRGTSGPGECYTCDFNNLIRSQEATLYGANFWHSQNFITGYLWLQDQMVTFEPASQGDVGPPLRSHDQRGCHVSFTMVVCHLDSVVTLREGQLTCVAREWPVLHPEPQLPSVMMKQPDGNPRIDQYSKTVDSLRFWKHQQPEENPPFFCPRWSFFLCLGVSFFLQLSSHCIVFDVSVSWTWLSELHKDTDTGCRFYFDVFLMYWCIYFILLFFTSFSHMERKECWEHLSVLQSCRVKTSVNSYGYLCMRGANPLAWRMTVEVQQCKYYEE